MKLRDIFTEAFWKRQWEATLDGFAEYGRAVTGQPPLSMTPDPQAEAEKPAARTAEKKSPDAPKL
jgi:hypothetical protein